MARLPVFTFTRYLVNGDTGDEIEITEEIPARWEICGCCQGTGGTSAYLGCFTASEFDDAFDYEEQERYFAGGYDRTCGECHGSGKVIVPTGEGTEEEKALFRLFLAQEECRAADAAEAAAERRFGC